jgi:hypothetical protein
MPSTADSSQATDPAAVDDELTREEPWVVDGRPPLLAALALELGAELTLVRPKLLIEEDLRRLPLRAT